VARAVSSRGWPPSRPEGLAPAGQAAQGKRGIDDGVGHVPGHVHDQHPPPARRKRGPRTTRSSSGAVMIRSRIESHPTASVTRRSERAPQCPDRLDDELSEVGTPSHDPPRPPASAVSDSPDVGGPGASAGRPPPPRPLPRRRESPAPSAPVSSPPSGARGPNERSRLRSSRSPLAVAPIEDRARGADGAGWTSSGCPHRRRSIHLCPAGSWRPFLRWGAHHRPGRRRGLSGSGPGSSPVTSVRLVDG